MESSFDNSESSHNDSLLLKKVENSCVETTTNWEIDNNKNLDECISTALLSQAPEKTDLEDAVSLDTCVALKADPSKDACKIEFKIINKQKIARIAVVSEASVLEFFKQSGEYATTVFAEFIDEFQDHAVYFAEATIQPPSSEASIQFTRTKNKGTVMWIYGIKLILTESSSSENTRGMFNLDVINSFLRNASQSNSSKADMAKRFFESFADCDNPVADNASMYMKKFPSLDWNPQRLTENTSNEFSQLNNINNEAGCNDDFTSKDTFDLKTYIDNKFTNMEKRLMERIEVMDKSTNQKLDAILKKLDLNVNNE